MEWNGMEWNGQSIWLVLSKGIIQRAGVAVLTDFYGHSGQASSVFQTGRVPQSRIFYA